MENQEWQENRTASDGPGIGGYVLGGSILAGIGGFALAMTDAGVPDGPTLPRVIGGVVVLCSFVALFVSFVIVDAENKRKQLERERLKPERDAKIICPQCQTRGHVTTKKMQVRRGIHGGKATAAILTGGVSLLGTGLSNKEAATEAECSNCGSVWHF